MIKIYNFYVSVYNLWNLQGDHLLWIAAIEPSWKFALKFLCSSDKKKRKNKSLKAVWIVFLFIYIFFHHGCHKSLV